MKRRSFNAFIATALVAPVVCKAAAKPQSDWALYPWQKSIIYESGKTGAMISVAACCESGKTSVLIPDMAVAHAFKHPGSQVVVLSASERQLNCQAIPAFRKRTYGMLEESGKMFTFPEVDGLPGSTVSFLSAHKPEGLEGYHTRIYQDDNGENRYCPIMVIVDEAKSLSKEKNGAIDRINASSLIMLGSAGDKSGPFFETLINPLWKTYRIPWTDCPHLMTGHTYDRKLAMISRYGRHSSMVKNVLLGEFA